LLVQCRQTILRRLATTGDEQALSLQLVALELHLRVREEPQPIDCGSDAPVAKEIQR
jgi:hypothetical protein